MHAQDEPVAPLVAVPELAPRHRRGGSSTAGGRRSLVSGSLGAVADPETHLSGGRLQRTEHVPHPAVPGEVADSPVRAPARKPAAPDQWRAVPEPNSSRQNVPPLPGDRRCGARGPCSPEGSGPSSRPRSPGSAGAALRTSPAHRSTRNTRGWATPAQRSDRTAHRSQVSAGPRTGSPGIQDSRFT